MNQINKSALNANYFILFGLPEVYEVDSKKLRMAYTALQSQYHPDRFATSATAEKNEALQASSYLNHAIETLKSPAKRATYLLELKGISISEHANLCGDTDFLMEQLHLRELLESALNSEVPEDLIDKVQDTALQLQNQEGRKFCWAYGQLQPLSSFDKDESLLSSTRDSVLKLRFLEKLFDEVEALQVRLLD